MSWRAEQGGFIISCKNGNLQISKYTQLDWCQTKRGESEFGDRKFRGAWDTGTPNTGLEKKLKSNFLGYSEDQMIGRMHENAGDENSEPNF